MEGKKHESSESPKMKMDEAMKERMKNCTEVKCDTGGPGSMHSKTVKMKMQGMKDNN